MSHIDAQSPKTLAVENASTGPRTEAGKAVSSRNAVKHNLCSKRLVGTDLEELNAIRAKLDDEWEPSTETERMLLDQMALSQWRMDRALSLELTAFDDENIDPALLALALRYRTATLDYLCYAPIGAPPPPQFVSQNQNPGGNALVGQARGLQAASHAAV